MTEPRIPEGILVIERISGHVIKRAPGAGKEANWGYKVKDQSGNEFALLYCNPGAYTIVDLNKLDELKNYTWYIMKTGYPGTHITLGDKQTVITLHSILMKHIGHGKGQVSVDHINQNKLDNRMSNLRLATQ
jgi:hypothetical protein